MARTRKDVSAVPAPILPRVYDISQEGIAQEIAKVGFANMGEYLRADGSPRALSELSVEQTAALKKLKIVEGEDGGRRIELELHDKLEALSQLARYQGMFVDQRLTLSYEVQVANMTREERLEEMRKLLEPMREYLDERDGFGLEENTVSGASKAAGTLGSALEEDET